MGNEIKVKKNNPPVLTGFARKVLYVCVCVCVCVFVCVCVCLPVCVCVFSLSLLCSPSRFYFSSSRLSTARIHFYHIYHTGAGHTHLTLPPSPIFLPLPFSPSFFPPLRRSVAPRSTRSVTSPKPSAPTTSWQLCLTTSKSKNDRIAFARLSLSPSSPKRAPLSRFYRDS